jgi:hypothetical protein
MNQFLAKRGRRCTLTGYNGLDDRYSYSIPCKEFSLRHRVQTGSGIHSGVFFPCGYIRAPPILPTLRIRGTILPRHIRPHGEVLIKDTDNFTFAFLAY